MIFDLEAIEKSLRQEVAVERKKAELFRFFLKCILIAGTIALIFTFVVGIVRISGSSMYPDVKNGDLALYNRLDRSCERGDVVIIYDPVVQKHYIKRVIANEGETVMLTPEGQVMVDGTLLQETYVGQLKTLAQDIVFPVTVPKDSVFVLGDNRPISKDSRNSTIGMVPLEHIRGGLLFLVRLYN